MKSIYEFLLKNKTAASTQDIQDTDYVDLGLPSGLLWARCNIGAEKPTEYGDYFMWGSTEPNTNDDCCWAHAPFNDGRQNFNISYFRSVQNKVCPNGVLTPEYDAASIIMGDDWRMPTRTDFRELIDNTKQEWVNNYKDSKVNGTLFTPVVFTPKNGEAAKANSDENYAELFIPASGYRCLTSFHTRGTYMYLWGSTICADRANSVTCLCSDDYSCFMNYNGRYYGCCLRGVKEN